MSLAEVLRTQSELSAHELSLQNANNLVNEVRQAAERAARKGENETYTYSNALSFELVRDIVRAKLEEDGFSVKIKYGFFTTTPSIKISW